MRQKLLRIPRSPSILCLTCVNHAVALGDAIGNRKTTETCGAGVCRLRDRFSCESYVRLFDAVPFLTEPAPHPTYDAAG